MASRFVLQCWLVVLLDGQIWHSPGQRLLSPREHNISEETSSSAGRPHEVRATKTAARDSNLLANEVFQHVSTTTANQESHLMPIQLSITTSSANQSYLVPYSPEVAQPDLADESSGNFDGMLPLQPSPIASKPAFGSDENLQVNLSTRITANPILETLKSTANFRSTNEVLPFQALPTWSVDANLLDTERKQELWTSKERDSFLSSANADTNGVDDLGDVEYLWNDNNPKVDESLSLNASATNNSRLLPNSGPLVSDPFQDDIGSSLDSNKTGEGSEEDDEGLPYDYDGDDEYDDKNSEGSSEQDVKISKTFAYSIQSRAGGQFPAEIEFADGQRQVVINDITGSRRTKSEVDLFVTCSWVAVMTVALAVTVISFRYRQKAVNLFWALKFRAAKYRRRDRVHVNEEGHTLLNEQRI